MSAKRLLEMTQAWHDCEVELKQLRALLQLRGKQTEVMKGQITALQTDNAQLRYELLCPKCQRYLDSKEPGDIPSWPYHVLHVLGPKGMPKTFLKYKAQPPPHRYHCSP